MLTIDTPAAASRNRTRRRYDGSAQVAVLGALWFGYAAVRGLTGNTAEVARLNASRLLGVEAALGLDVERALQSAVDWPEALVAANSYYLLHFPITLIVMVLTFRWSRCAVFPVLRNSLIGSTAVALAVHFVVPMAPPRMLPGFIDTGAAFGPDPYAIAGSELANQFAAMPSMHVAWAVICAHAVLLLSGHRVVRFVAVVHPILTGLVVIVTGHHFVIDVAIGATLAVACLAVTVGARRRLLDVATEPQTSQPR